MSDSFFGIDRSSGPPPKFIVDAARETDLPGYAIVSPSMFRLLKLMSIDIGWETRKRLRRIALLLRRSPR